MAPEQAAADPQSDAGSHCTGVVGCRCSPARTCPPAARRCLRTRRRGAVIARRPRPLRPRHLPVERLPEKPRRRPEPRSSLVSAFAAIIDAPAPNRSARAVATFINRSGDRTLDPLGAMAVDARGLARDGGGVGTAAEIGTESSVALPKRRACTHIRHTLAGRQRFARGHSSLMPRENALMQPGPSAAARASPLAGATASASHEIGIGCATSARRDGIASLVISFIDDRRQPGTCRTPSAFD